MVANSLEPRNVVFSKIDMPVFDSNQRRRLIEVLGTGGFTWSIGSASQRVPDHDGPESDPQVAKKKRKRAKQRQKQFMTPSGYVQGSERH